MAQRQQSTEYTFALPQAVEVAMPVCGHRVEATCSERAALLADPTRCKATCGAVLACGDPCNSKCGACISSVLAGAHDALAQGEPNALPVALYDSRS